MGDKIYVCAGTKYPLEIQRYWYQISVVWMVWVQVDCSNRPGGLCELTVRGCLGYELVHGRDTRWEMGHLVVITGNDQCFLVTIGLSYRYSRPVSKLGTMDPGMTWIESVGKCITGHLHVPVIYM